MKMRFEDLLPVVLVAGAMSMMPCAASALGVSFGNLGSKFSADHGYTEFNGFGGKQNFGDKGHRLGKGPIADLLGEAGGDKRHHGYLGSQPSPAPVPVPATLPLLLGDLV